jgi:hypothetical protein
MISRPPPRKPDFFVMLLLTVAIGMSATVAYQVNIYFYNSDMALARQAQTAPPSVGG